MADDGFQMWPGAVTAHAGAVDRVGDGMERGRAAAAHVQLGGDAYGQAVRLPAGADRCAGRPGSRRFDRVHRCAPGDRCESADIGGVSASLEGLGLLVDPLGSLASWGAAWLIDRYGPVGQTPVVQGGGEWKTFYPNGGQ